MKVLIVLVLNKKNFVIDGNKIFLEFQFHFEVLLIFLFHDEVEVYLFSFLILLQLLGNFFGLGRDKFRQMHHFPIFYLNIINSDYQVLLLFETRPFF